MLTLVIFILIFMLMLMFIRIPHVPLYPLADPHAHCYPHFHLYALNTYYISQLQFPNL